jgi:hypothetical protein
MTALVTRPADVSRLLGLCEHPMTERRLVDWRVRELLPDLDRVPPGRGQGPRAAYAWPDRGVVVQALTLSASLQFHGRLNMAQLLTWLAGFDYPVDEMRDRWANLEERRWKSALKSVGEDPLGDIGAAIDTLVLEAKAVPATRRMDLSEATVRTYVRALADPTFEPQADLDLGVADRIRDDLPRLFANLSNQELLVFVKPEHIQNLAKLIRDYVSTPRLVSLIRTVDNELLQAVHDDCRVLLGAYRAWVIDAIGRAERDKEWDPLALAWAPRFIWRIGRMLMILDLAIRRLGFQGELAQTFLAIKELTGSAQNRETISWLWDLHKATAAAVGTEPNEYLPEYRRRLEADHGAVITTTLTALAQSILATIRDIWGDAAQGLFRSLAGGSH